VGINYDDPEVEMTATKIQAGFNEQQARKEMNKKKKEK
jgi:hypothetical protein